MDPIQANLDTIAAGGRFVGRVWSRAAGGPCVVALRGDGVFDLTDEFPTMSALLASDDPAAAADAAHRRIGDIEDLLRGTLDRRAVGEDDHILAPSDLQALKACGVTFARSMVERVIEEQAEGDPAKADAIRREVASVIGDSLRDVVPGSQQAAEVKRLLIEKGLWSQYLEVGIGPDAEVFTKSQPMSAVGFGADIGLHPISTWNNPEPEVVLAVAPTGRIVGACLGNDVNLRDVEGRSALLLGKAKDNNGSCAIGPFIRLLDESFTIDDIAGLHLGLGVDGADGFRLDGASSMAEASRTPTDLARQMIGRHHQYPDGALLFLGTLFAPTEDRDVPGGGFTHKLGDIVTIAAPELGALVNRVGLSTEIPPWTFGTGELMRNLAARGLL